MFISQFLQSVPLFSPPLHILNPRNLAQLVPSSSFSFSMSFVLTNSSAAGTAEKTLILVYSFPMNVPPLYILGKLYVIMLQEYVQNSLNSAILHIFWATSVYRGKLQLHWLKRSYLVSLTSPCSMSSFIKAHWSNRSSQATAITTKSRHTIFLEMITIFSSSTRCSFDCQTLTVSLS